MTVSTRLSIPLLACSVGLALGACSTPGSPTPAPQPSPQSAQSTATPTDAGQSASAQSSASPSESATRPINGDAWVRSLNDLAPQTTDDPMVFTDLRVGEHADFYRVTVEFTGTGSPGYFVSWSDEPREQGRGEPLEVSGEVFLDIVLSGTTMPVDEALQPRYYDGPKTLAIGPIEVIEDGTFEDTTHIAIGMDAQRDFQIGFLADPVRAVIDIKR